TPDNVINLAESASAAVSVSGTVFGDYTPGATVNLTLSNGATASAVVNADGTWSTTVPGADLAASTSISVSLATTDTAGNSVTVVDTQSYSVDLTPPPAPIIISANGLGINGGSEAGATVTLLDANGGVLTSVVAGANGLWTIPASAISVPLDGFVGSVVVTDPPGNLTSVGVGPIDGATPAPSVDVANGLELEG
ncbi:hypothetical protein LTR94_030886, partial [Friedmanniomyces endolithicus]